MIVHFNGDLVPLDRARVSVLDRGFLLGDGVYEAFRAFRGVPVAIDRHAARLAESLLQLGIPFDADSLLPLTARLLAANALDDAFVYWQITRGVPGPDQPVRSRVPAGPMTPTVFGYAVPQPPLHSLREPPTCAASTVPDRRWLRGRIKSISLAGNVLSALEASATGGTEAVMVRDGLVSEACASNVLLVHRTGSTTRIATPSLQSVPILAGVTRARLLELDPSIEERPVRREELDSADEILLCGTTSLVTAVTTLDGRPVGTGSPGPQARRLFSLLIEATLAEVDAALVAARAS